MTDDDTGQSERPAPQPNRSFGEWLRDMPRWKKVSVGVALATAAVAGVVSLTSGDPEPVSTAGKTSSELSASLIETTPGQQGNVAAEATDEPASKGVFRLGFSFLAGFCIGTFVRAMLKIAAIAVGFWLVMTFVLSYAGLVNVDWNAMDDLWTRFTSNIEQEWGSFQSFMLGSLPATALAGTGLAIGFRRH